MLLTVSLTSTTANHRQTQTQCITNTSQQREQVQSRLSTMHSSSTRKQTRHLLLLLWSVRRPTPNTYMHCRNTSTDSQLCCNIHNSDGVQAIHHPTSVHCVKVLLPVYQPQGSDAMRLGSKGRHGVICT